MPDTLCRVREHAPTARAFSHNSATGLIVPSVLEMWLIEKSFTSGVSN